MDITDSVSPENLKLSDFIRTEGGDGVLISGMSTPDVLTELRQIYESCGAASLNAQMEIAWYDDNDDAVRDIAKLLDSTK